jgi:hypothetical protein
MLKNQSNKFLWNSYKEVYLRFQKTLLKLFSEETDPEKKIWLNSQIKELGDIYKEAKSKFVERS